MAKEQININELVFDKMRTLVLQDPDTGETILRLTQVRDSSLSTNAESESVTDGNGATIMTLYQAKTAQMSGTNALWSLDLSAVQYGSAKEIASAEKTIKTPYFFTAKLAEGKITLPENRTPIEGSLLFIYKLENNGLSSVRYELGAGEAEGETFTLEGNVVTLPADADAEGVYWGTYEYESKLANKVVNNASTFPGVYKVIAECIFRDPCNKNHQYAGYIIGERGEIDPTSIEQALSRTDGHAFNINFNKNYCDNEADDLFSVIVDPE